MAHPQCLGAPNTPQLHFYLIYPENSLFMFLILPPSYHHNTSKAILYYRTIWSFIYLFIYNFLPGGMCSGGNLYFTRCFGGDLGLLSLFSYLARRSSWAYLQLEGSCKKGNVFAYRLGFAIISLR